MAGVTRLGLYGGPRGPYGSFTGKTTQVIVDVRSAGGISKEESAAKIRRRNKRLIRQITQDDEEVLALYLAIHG
jgi:hypothetical protein